MANVNEHDGRRSTLEWTHSLSRGAIRKPNVAMRAVWVLERFNVVLLERGFGRIHDIAESACGAEGICTMDGGVHVLWPIETYAGE